MSTVLMCVTKEEGYKVVNYAEKWFVVGYDFLVPVKNEFEGKQLVEDLNEDLQHEGVA